MLDGAWDDDRYGNLLAVLATLGGDVIGLQEAKEWDKHDFARVCETAEALGMQALFAPSASHECHLVLLYRAEALSLKKWTPDAACRKFHHTLQRAEFAIRATGEDVTVLHTHLDPFSGDGRKKEASWLTEYAKHDTSGVLLGDLNTIGADDPEPNWDLFPPRLHSRHRLVLPDGRFGPADRRAIRSLTAAGFVDPFTHLGLGPVPTVGHFDPREPDEHRSDHILVSPGLTDRLLGCAVVNTPQAKRGSDHLMVVTQIAHRAPATPESVNP
ncbi:endonuclease/exonuclease/phosphatase [Streptomyces sp. SID3343]|nr:endonuclease/exonuclease/phosphatase [Streptomyces sp. SID3343]